MLTQVSMKDIPMINLTRERIRKEEISFLNRVSREAFDQSCVLKGVLVIGYLTKGQVIVTLGCENSNLDEVDLLIRDLETYFRKLIFFKEGDVYKVQAEKINAEMGEIAQIIDQVPEDVSSLFGIQTEILEPGQVKAYKVLNDDDLGPFDQWERAGSEILSKYIEHELQYNQRFFSIPMSNLSLSEVEENNYINYLANKFRELYVIGCGDSWVTTHLVLVD